MFSLPAKIKKTIESKLGFEVKYPADCERLAFSIRSSINETIGVTTLKRLFGFVSDVQEPRPSTLDILARFCGFTTYDEMKRMAAGKGDSDFEEQPDIEVSKLQKGAVIRFEYLPDRKVALEYLGGSEFIVTDCANGSLREGDILTIDCFNEGFPLIVSNVERNGERLGRYAAGKESGISNLSCNYE